MSLLMRFLRSLKNRKERVLQALVEEVNVQNSFVRLKEFLLKN